MPRAAQRFVVGQAPSNRQGEGRAGHMATLIGWSGQRKCAKCGRVALRGKAFCGWHGGSAAPNPSPERLASRTLERMDHKGMIPRELVALMLWQTLARMPMTRRAPHQLALVLNWHRRHSEPVAWATVWRAASREAADGYQKAAWGKANPWRLADAA